MIHFLFRLFFDSILVSFFWYSIFAFIFVLIHFWIALYVYPILFSFIPWSNLGLLSSFTQFWIFFPWTNFRLLPSFNFRFFSLESILDCYICWPTLGFLSSFTNFGLLFSLIQFWTIVFFINPTCIIVLVDLLLLSILINPTFHAFGYSIKLWCLTKSKDSHT
jgi:hypothetical protein